MRFILPVSAVITFAVTAFLLKILIPVLKSKKMGQKILDIGPRWHKDKEGTPTMGGISFIAAVTLVTLPIWFFFARNGENSYAFLFSLFYCIASGFIGVSDDICKFRKKENEGLSASQKYLLQLLAGSLYLILMRRFGYISETIYIPFANKYLDLGFFFYPISLLFLSGFNNAVNLTDGVDGLCSSVTASVSIVFFIISFVAENNSLSLFSASVFGAMLGFLLFNLHPAKVFMGDTGSLFLGGAVSSMAIMSESPALLFIIGIVYVIEAASVILQVLYFKLTQKRLFKMAPLHHHLEKCSWGENMITLSASLLTLSAGLICVIFI